MSELPAGKAKRKPNSGFIKPVTPDEQLAAIIGPEPVPRTDVTRKMWEYIRSHGLQDSENKTYIRADERLKLLFGGKERVSMFEMTKLVFSHVS